MVIYISFSVDEEEGLLEDSISNDKPDDSEESSERKETSNNADSDDIMVNTCSSIISIFKFWSLNNKIMFVLVPSFHAFHTRKTEQTSW